MWCLLPPSTSCLYIFVCLETSKQVGSAWRVSLRRCGYTSLFIGLYIVMRCFCRPRACSRVSPGVTAHYVGVNCAIMAASWLLCLWQDGYVNQQLQVLSVYSGVTCAPLDNYLLLCIRFGCGFSCGQAKTTLAVAAVDVTLSELEKKGSCQVH